MPGLFGGAKRDRTADLLNAIQALSQLSYSPEQEQIYNRAKRECQLNFMLKALRAREKILSLLGPLVQLLPELFDIADQAKMLSIVDRVIQGAV